MKYRVVMVAEMKPDVYAEGGHRPRWNAYAEGDKQDDTSEQPLILDPQFFPAGTKVEVREPICPECDVVASICDCGFDWNEWAETEYS